jgi:hypothetical protein
MSTTIDELQQFYDFIGQRIRAGETELSPEEAARSATKSR